LLHRPFTAGAAACALLLTACGKTGSNPIGPALPSGSFHVEQRDLVYANVSENIRCAFVRDAFARAVKPQPLIGRTFQPEEYQSASHSVLVLSYAIWQRRFGADPAIIGRAVRLGDGVFTIVGILPKDFRIPPDAEAWIPQPDAPK
jgi:hypothetical protein